jgi:hypothetical protein
MFLFKKKEIVVDCFTYEPLIHDACKISPAKKFLPDWYKKLPTSFSKIVPNSLGIEVEQSTIRRCPGVNNLFGSGFMIPLWSDLKIKSTETEWKHVFSFEPDGTGIESHPKTQYGPVFDLYFHLKIQSPWMFKEKTGVHFTWLQPTWNLVNHMQELVIVPAVTEFKYQNATNINLFIPKNDNEIFIKAGTPLVHLIPLSEDQIIIKNHLVSRDEYVKIAHSRGPALTFTNKYRNIKNIIQREEKEQKKCPFGFGK